LKFNLLVPALKRTMTTIHEQRFALELGESRKLQIRSSDAAIAGR